MAHKEMRGLEYLVYSTVSLCLLLVMVLLPLAPLFADEVTTDAESSDSVIVESLPDTELASSNNETEPEVTTLDEAPVVVDDIFLDEGEAVDSSISEISETNDAEIASIIEEVTPLSHLEESVAEVIIDTDDELATEGSTSTNAVIADEGTTTPEIMLTSEVVGTTTDESLLLNDGDEDIPELVDDEIEIDDVLFVDEIEETPATVNELIEEIVTATSSENTIVVNTFTNDENRFSFSKNECTTSGDGTFYCVKDDISPEVRHTDRIFASNDAEGDKEIYVEKDGELIPLTSNLYDDDAPYYDEVSNTAVWHRLIEGRYQIISFEFDTEEETQFTNDRFNNMEPNRFGNTTVWQGWVGNDWEVFLLETDVVTMLTDNATHDIMPSVNGSHVVWQSFENNVWVMKVYDIRTKEVNTIEDMGGGSIENPRFVLVYDAKQETGDIETRGYDLKSGKVVQLGSVPVNFPDEIPEPDQTGEERALVTTITQLKPKTEDEGGDEPLPDAPSTSTPNGTDVIVPPIIDTVATTTTNISEEMLPASSTTDVIIPTAEADEVRDTAHIEDVIVTPYVELTATTTDAQ